MRTKGERRRDAVEACRKRFVGKSYDPKANRDCVRLASHAARQMGHRISILKGLKYSTEAGALKVLRKLGFKDLIEAVDASGLERIAPAMAMQADILAFPSEDAFGCCLYVYAGNGKAHGYMDGHGVGVTVTLHQPAIAAWRL
ncbi:DUF6950 family protein [Brevundimonas sp. LjRoot202]|uniref:DUF6950 family protein n=1 Tax=Brevundimonas sp. LjRoot202 TaxID=3342281 RepID=UPI003ED0745E